MVSTGEGRASVDFPEVVGRYVMLKWHPANARGEAFIVAQVVSLGISKHGAAYRVENAEGGQMIDGKEAMRDGKGFSTAKTSRRKAPVKLKPLQKDLSAGIADKFRCLPLSLRKAPTSP